MGDSAPIFRLIYRSRNRIISSKRQSELGSLFSAARSNNKKLQVTGALLIYGDWFAQALEGDQEQVIKLYDKIALDRRHEHLEILDQQTVPDRVFSRWAMARVSEDGEPDIPLIAHQDGIAPAAGHKVSDEQEEVLSFMRQSTREPAGA